MADVILRHFSNIEGDRSGRSTESVHLSSAPSLGESARKDLSLVSVRTILVTRKGALSLEPGQTKGFQVLAARHTHHMGGVIWTPWRARSVH